MFCPKCATEAAENQRYCKACGTHLQMIYDALGNSESGKEIYGIDVEALSRNARRFAESWKAGWSSGAVTEKGPGSVITRNHSAKTAPSHPPKPKEWLRYSWQHNLRDGLLSLFGGVGLGVVLYYLSRPPLIEDILRSIDPLTNTGTDINAIARLATFLWMFASIPVLKGLAQIIYAAFFAESIGKLTERFVVAPAQIASAPQAVESVVTPTFDEYPEPVPSVTDHTTKIIDGTPAERAKTSQ